MFMITFLCASSIKTDAEKEINNQFGVGVSVQFQKISLSKELRREIFSKTKQRFYMDEVYLWKITKGEKVKGYAILDNVKGKSLAITFLVIFDNDSNVLYSTVIKYREPYGGEIAHPNWNKQFIGYNSYSPFIVGKDIDGISGATISVHSMTRGIHKLSYLIKVLKEEL